MIVLAWIIVITLVLLALAVGALAVSNARTARQVEKALPPLGSFIDIDGSRIHYLDRGSGPTILCIHGLAGQMRHFTYALLDKLKSDYRVVIVDRPGSGYSTRPPQASAAIFAQARTLAKFAAALRLERPLVVGHSLGGAIALALALNHPEHVGGLALLAPLTHPQESCRRCFGGSRSDRRSCAGSWRGRWRYPCRSGTPQRCSTPCSVRSRCRRISAPRAAPYWACGRALHHRLGRPRRRPRGPRSHAGPLQ